MDRTWFFFFFVSLWIILWPVNLSPCLFSVVLKMELSCPLLDAHLRCNPIKAPFLTPRVSCLVFPASLALSKLLCNSWLTHPLQCGKQVVPPRAEGSRSRTDGCSVSFWGWGGGDSLGSIYYSEPTRARPMLQNTLVCCGLLL